MTMLETELRDEFSCVRVALRIRPQSAREKLESCRVCTNMTPGEPQVTIGEDRCFTYDHVFDQQISQISIFDKCICDLINGTFEGFNATVLAYGQTGSGKTYTMGTAFDMVDHLQKDEVGIIPRAVMYLFDEIETRKQDARQRKEMEPMFEVATQFVELYNEELVDLLVDDRYPQAALRIHEDCNGEIFLHGVTKCIVTSPPETLSVLRNGALNRKTGSTNMNEQSSRSHAIFTMFIKQKRINVLSTTVQNTDEVDGNAAEMTPAQTEFDIFSAKFHFVDLAGSERLKRTGATGHRAKEGISINCGLLSLGNVISALGGSSSKVCHVPYRDSKLTRLLQDSLGGNSRTLMIACISPSDCDFVETLNTLKYANRAKNIKNKVVVNRDRSSKLLSQLRCRITELEEELAEYKQGRITLGSDGMKAINDHYRENLLLHADAAQLRIRIKALQETVEMMKARNIQLIAEKEELSFTRTAQKETSESAGITGSTNEEFFSEAIRNYLSEAESLRTALMESNAVNEQLRRQINQLKAASVFSGAAFSEFDSLSTSFCSEQLELPDSPPALSVLSEAKADIARRKKFFNDESAEVIDSKIIEKNDCSSSRMDKNLVQEDIYSNLACIESHIHHSSPSGHDYEDEDFDEEENSAELECVKLRDDLVDLQGEISLKERLVMELERSERRLAEVRIIYERKLSELSLRITATEVERDRILAEMVSKTTKKANSDELRRVREDYEKRLNSMREEFHKLQLVEREHKRMQARQAAEQQQLMKLRNELSEMKKTKVQLMQKLKDETRRAKAIEVANSKKFVGLEKEARKKDNVIRQLMSKDRQREMFLKRSMDEINRLRQQSRLANRMIGSSRSGNRPNIISKSGNAANRYVVPNLATREMKARWNAIENYIHRKITQKQIVMKMEEELERRINERRELFAQIEQLMDQFIVQEKLAERDMIAELIDGCQEKLQYTENQINEMQRSIIEIDNDKENVANEYLASDTAESIFNNCANLIEAKYLLNHLFTLGLDQGFLAAKAISDLKESEAYIEQLKYAAEISPLMSNAINDSIIHDIAEVIKSAKLNRGRSIPADLFHEKVAVEVKLFASLPPSPTNKRSKIRHRNATADELLFVKDMNALKRTPGTCNLQSDTNDIAQMAENGVVSAELDNQRSSSTPSSTSTTTPTHIPQNRKVGRIIPYIARTPAGLRDVKAASKLLIRSHTIDGHTKSVLSLDFYDNSLITGSKDRQAKIWDLHSACEKANLGLHANNVTCVRFIPNTHLALSVSTSTVRLWDLRLNQNIRTLHSSGLSADGDSLPANSPRQNMVPISETVISATEIDASGRLLFTSYCGDVRIWNLDKFAAFGRLNGAVHGTRSEVSCLEISMQPKSHVFTGSRDHYVKLFNIDASGEGIYEATAEFSPRHYDSITSLLTFDESLFTASKDSNIMRFSLSDLKRDHIELKAHNKSIMDMCLIHSQRTLLASACKEGSLKLWDISSNRKLRLIEEISNAHFDSINGIIAKSCIIFTASSDSTVGLWRLSCD